MIWTRILKLNNFEYSRTLIFLSCCLLLAACTSSPKVTYDEQVNFEAPKTFTWLDENPLKYSATDYNVNPFLEGYLMEATKKQMEAKGYRFVERSANPDFAVAFTFGARDKIDVNSYPGYVGYGRRGYWGGAYVGGTTTARSYTEGQLSIDVFSEQTKKPAWHGTDEGTIKNNSGDELRKSVDEQVAKMLETFPPGQ